MENEAKPKKKEFNTCLLYLLIGLMLFTGSTNTIATKTQTKLKGLNILYEEHQWFITLMFIGEMFSLIGYVVHMVQKCKKKNAVENDSLVEEHHEGEEKPEASNFIFASTAMCDYIEYIW